MIKELYQALVPTESPSGSYPMLKVTTMTTPYSHISEMTVLEEILSTPYYHSQFNINSLISEPEHQNLHRVPPTIHFCLSTPGIPSTVASDNITSTYRSLEINSTTRDINANPHCCNCPHCHLCIPPPGSLLPRYRFIPSAGKQYDHSIRIRSPRSDVLLPESSSCSPLQRLHTRHLRYPPPFLWHVRGPGN